MTAADKLAATPCLRRQGGTRSSRDGFQPAEFQPAPEPYRPGVFDESDSLIVLVEIHSQNRRRNTSSDSCRPSGESATDLAFFFGSEIRPFLWRRSRASQSSPFHARVTANAPLPSVKLVKYNNASTASSILFSLGFMVVNSMDGFRGNWNKLTKTEVAGMAETEGAADRFSGLELHGESQSPGPRKPVECASFSPDIS